MRSRFFFLFVLMTTFCFGQQFIKGKFSPVEEFDWILVYKVAPTHSDYVGDAKIDEKGNFEFELDSTQKKGMYRLVYAVPQEEYNFDVIYNAKEDIEFSFNMETGLDYVSSSENKLMTSYTNSMAMISQSIGNFYRQRSQDSSALMSIFKTQRDTQNEFEKISKGTIAANFIKANRPYIPKSFESIDEYVANLKKHFFDHVNFNNEILQSSNFLIERSLNYVFGMLTSDSNDLDVYKRNLDDLAAVMEDATTESKKILWHILWQQFSESNMEEIANYLADSFLIPVATELGETVLVTELTNFRNLSHGKLAPDFKIELVDNGKITSTSLHNIDLAEQYIVVFWSSSCSHCLEELPQLHDYMKTIASKNVKVIAFGLEDDQIGWKNAKNNYPDFIHVLGLGKWNNETGNAYDVSSTPTYFVLDQDKKIVGKPLDFEALKKFYSSQK